MPHPTTMAFAWEEEVQRCSRILVCTFLLAVMGFIGVAGLSGRAQDTTLVVAAEPLTVATTGTEVRFSSDPEQRVATRDRRFSFSPWASTSAISGVVWRELDRGRSRSWVGIGFR